MANRTKLTDEKIVHIQALRRRGLSYSAISKEVGLSVGTVSKALRARTKGKAKGTVMRPRKDQDTPKAEARKTRSKGRPLDLETREGESDDEAYLRILKRQVAEIDQQMADARKNNDTAAYASYARLLNQTMAQIAKMTPPRKDDPNEQPDMIAAAERGRAKLHTILDNLYAKKEQSEEAPPPSP